MDIPKLFESKKKEKVGLHQNIATPKSFVVSGSAENVRFSVIFPQIFLMIIWYDNSGDIDRK